LSVDVTRFKNRDNIVVDVADTWVQENQWKGTEMVRVSRASNSA